MFFGQLYGLNLSPKTQLTFAQLTRHYRRVLVRKGLLTNEEVLEEIKVVRREMEAEKGTSVCGRFTLRAPATKKV